jgi:hypothetical protein
MPMMRRGPLDRYSAEWVLRQAHAHEVSGGLEFHTDRPVTIHVHEGRVYGACTGVGPQAAEAAPAPADEDEGRQHAIALLAEVLDATTGWYYLDPLAHAPSRGAWGWEPATLLMEVRARAHEDRTLASWTERPVLLRPSRREPITVGPDAWAVIAACARSASAAELRSLLGWNPGRLLAALTELDQRGALADALGSSDAVEPAVAAGSTPALPSEGPALGTPDRSGRHHRGPLPPPPDLAPGTSLHPAPIPTPTPRGPLRRRMPGRRIDAP